MSGFMNAVQRAYPDGVQTTSRELFDNIRLPTGERFPFTNVGAVTRHLKDSAEWLASEGWVIEALPDTRPIVWWIKPPVKEEPFDDSNAIGVEEAAKLLKDAFKRKPEPVAVPEPEPTLHDVIAGLTLLTGKQAEVHAELVAHVRFHANDKQEIIEDVGNLIDDFQAGITDDFLEHADFDDGMSDIHSKLNDLAGDVAALSKGVKELMDWVRAQSEARTVRIELMEEDHREAMAKLNRPWWKFWGKQ